MPRHGNEAKSQLFQLSQFRLHSLRNSLSKYLQIYSEYQGSTAR